MVTLVPSLGLRIGPAACEAGLSIVMRREHVPPQRIKIKIISMAADMEYDALQKFIFNHMNHLVIGLFVLVSDVYLQ